MTSTPTKPPRASRVADQSATETQPSITAPAHAVRATPRQAATAVRVVLPVGARPGLLRMGAYVPGVVYAVPPATAERLQARGFQIAVDVTDTADSATADGGAGGSNMQES